MSSTAELFSFDQQSTFTHIARNDAAVGHIMRYRKEHRMPSVRNVWIIGSGAIEPFTLAALEGLSSAHVYAIEINPSLVGIGEQIKRGNAIPWSTIAEYSHNPGRPNSDLTDTRRLQRGLDKLKALGSLGRLGGGFNTTTMQVNPAVADRVTFIHDDALSAMRDKRDIDLIVDCFARVNMNKKQGLGPMYAYTNQLTSDVLQSLATHGMYLIGDTGKSLPATVGSFMGNVNGDVNWGSLVHVVHREPGTFLTSHYTLASSMERLDTADILERAQQHILSHPHYYGRSITETNSLPHLQEQLYSGQVNLAYIRDAQGSGVSINIPSQGLFALAREKGTEFSPPADERGSGIIFPPQK
ncbi:MAG: hypothetical protein V1922_04610 [bacterium]